MHYRAPGSLASKNFELKREGRRTRALNAPTPRIDRTDAFQFCGGKRRLAWHCRQILNHAAISHDLFDLQMRQIFSTQSNCVLRAE